MSATSGGIDVWLLYVLYLVVLVVAERASRDGREYLSGVRSMPFSPRRFFVGGILGSEPLWRIFWIGGGGVGTPVVLLTALLLKSFPSLLAALAVSIVLVAYWSWLYWSLWRCAGNVTPRMALAGPFVKGLVVVKLLFFDAAKIFGLAASFAR